MSVDIYTAGNDDVPSHAVYSSTFTKDDRCFDKFYIVGSEYEEVYAKTLELFKGDENHIDYDVNRCSETETYVGVICEDY